MGRAWEEPVHTGSMKPSPVYDVHVHGELGAVHEELGAEMDAVLAWIATENEARERGRW